MKRRTLLRAAGGAATVGAASGAGYLGVALGDRPIVEGRIEGKSVTGTKSDTSYGIVHAQRDDLSVEDRSHEGKFATWQSLTVDEGLARELEFDYQTVQYNVHVTHDVQNDRHGVADGESLAYRVSREQFNAVAIGDEVAVRVADADVPRIETFTDGSRGD